MKKNYDTPILAVRSFCEEDVISTSVYVFNDGDLTHNDIFEKLNSGVE